VTTASASVREPYYWRWSWWIHPLSEEVKGQSISLVTRTNTPKKRQIVADSFETSKSNQYHKQFWNGEVYRLAVTQFLHYAVSTKKKSCGRRRSVKRITIGSNMRFESGTNCSRWGRYEAPRHYPPTVIFVHTNEKKSQNRRKLWSWQHQVDCEYKYQINRYLRGRSVRDGATQIPHEEVMLDEKSQKHKTKVAPKIKTRTLWSYCARFRSRK
jgi:hypothetical protein